jgi:hypothetical protein
MKKALIILALLAAPAAASAFEWTGRAGFMYQRSDVWPLVGDRISQPHFDLDLRLDARGYFGNPGIFDWAGGVAYRRIADSVDGRRTSLSDALSYRLTAALFQNRTSAFQLNLVASRTDSTLESLASSSTLSGDSTATRYGAHAQLRVAGVPTIQTGYELNQIEERLPGAALHSRDSQLADFGFAHSAGGAGIGMKFDGNWSTGTWTADNYDQYIVSASGRAHVTEKGELFFNDQYTHREPTATTGTFYGYDFNGFTAGFRQGMIPGDTATAFYRTLHSLIDASGLTTESVSHSGRYEQDFRLGDSKFFLRPLGDVTYFQQRFPTSTVTTSGETARCLLWWRDAADRASLFEWYAGPVIGLLQQPAEDPRVGYGASAAIRYSGPWLSNRLSTGYQVDWSEDVFGQRGWSLRQQASAGLTRPVAYGNLSIQGALSAYRGWTPTGGDLVQRSVQLSSIYSRQRYSADANFTLTSGRSPIVAGADFVGDGLFLPSGYQFHSLSLAIGGTAELFPNLKGRLQLRTASTRGPGQPDIAFLEAGGSLIYRYGAFDFSLEDRYQTSLNDPNAVPVNLLMLRVSRTIGSLY